MVVAATTVLTVVPQTVMPQVSQLLERGREVRGRGGIASAIAGFEAVLAVNASHVAAISERACALQEQGRLGEAERAFARVLEIVPVNILMRRSGDRARPCPSAP